jgi:hypothetical protein
MSSLGTGQNRDTRLRNLVGNPGRARLLVRFPQVSNPKEAPYLLARSSARDRAEEITEVDPGMCPGPLARSLAQGGDFDWTPTPTRATCVPVASTAETLDVLSPDVRDGPHPASTTSRWAGGCLAGEVEAPQPAFASQHQVSPAQ